MSDRKRKPSVEVLFLKRQKYLSKVAELLRQNKTNFELFITMLPLNPV